MKDLSKFGDNNRPDAIGRLQLREDGVNRLNHIVENGLTYKQIDEKRRKEAMEHNMRTFANTIIGVHGQEIPKFADDPNLKEYWKNRTGFYNPNPMQKSLLEYKQSVKYWAKPDEMRLADVKEIPPPEDKLKKFEKLVERKLEIPDKINAIPIPMENEANKDNNGIAVPKAGLNDAAFKKYKSIYDDDPMNRPSFVRKEEEPLYSSFSPDKIFKDPYPFYSVSQYFNMGINIK